MNMYGCLILPSFALWHNHFLPTHFLHTFPPFLLSFIIISLHITILLHIDHLRHPRSDVLPILLRILFPQCDRDLPSTLPSDGVDVDVEFREALSTSSSIANGLGSPGSPSTDATLNNSADDTTGVAPADPMQVDEAISPNPEVSISDSISEHTSTTTTTSNSDSTLTLDAAAPGNVVVHFLLFLIRQIAS